MYILCRNRERKCAAACEYIYFYVEDYVAASRNISMLFKERAATSENILTTASEIYSKKKCATASERYGGLYMTYILIHFFLQYNGRFASYAASYACNCLFGSYAASYVHNCRFASYAASYIDNC